VGGGAAAAGVPGVALVLAPGPGLVPVLAPVLAASPALALPTTRSHLLRRRTRMGLMSRSTRKSVKRRRGSPGPGLVLAHGLAPGQDPGRSKEPVTVSSHAVCPVVCSLLLWTGVGEAVLFGAVLVAGSRKGQGGVVVKERGGRETQRVQKEKWLLVCKAETAHRQRRLQTRCCSSKL